MKYPAIQNIQHAYHLNGPKPLDDKSVLKDISSIFIDSSLKKKTECILYNNVYEGFRTVAKDASGNYYRLLLTNAAPYTNNLEINECSVNEDNFKNYWQVEEAEVQDYLNDSFIFSDCSAITVDVSKNASVGNKYYINLNTEDNYIKVVDSSLTVGRYKLRECAVPNDDSSVNVLKSYEFVYLAPGAEDVPTNWKRINNEGVINIQKDFVLKEVHLCKVQTVKNAETDEVIFDTEHELVYDPNDAETIEEWNKRLRVNGYEVYMHYIWQTKTDSVEANYSETYLKVSDIISVDVLEINDHIEKLKNDINEIINTTLDNINKNLKVINSSIAILNSSVNYLDSSIQQIQKDLNDSSIHFKLDETLITRGDTMLSSHGSLTANTSIGGLENMTISEILYKILFEVATPTKVNDTALSMSCNGVNTLAVKNGDTVKAYTNNKFATSSKVETYKWVSSDGQKSRTMPVAEIANLTLQYKANSNDDFVDVSTLDADVSLTTGGVFRYKYDSVITSEYKETGVVDSGNSSVGEDGLEYYKLSDKSLYSTNTVKIVVVDSIKTNALAYYIKSDDLIAKKDENPEGTVENSINLDLGDIYVYNTSTKGVDFTAYNTVYLQWPDGIKNDDNISIFVEYPSYISEVKCAVYNDGANKYDYIDTIPDNDNVITERYNRITFAKSSARTNLRFEFK